MRGSDAERRHFTGDKHLEKHAKGKRSVAREDHFGTDFCVFRDAPLAHESCLKNRGALLEPLKSSPGPSRKTEVKSIRGAQVGRVRCASTQVGSTPTNNGRPRRDTTSAPSSSSSCGHKCLSRVTTKHLFQSVRTSVSFSLSFCFCSFSLSPSLSPSVSFLFFFFLLVCCTRGQALSCTCVRVLVRALIDGQNSRSTDTEDHTQCVVRVLTPTLVHPPQVCHRQRSGLVLHWLAHAPGHCLIMGASTTRRNFFLFFQDHSHGEAHFKNWR